MRGVKEDYVLKNSNISQIMRWESVIFINQIESTGMSVLVNQFHSDFFYEIL